MRSVRAGQKRRIRLKKRGKKKYPTTPRSLAAATGRRRVYRTKRRR